MDTRFIGQVIRWVRAFLPAVMLAGNGRQPPRRNAFDARRGRLRHQRLHLHLRRDAAGAADSLPTLGKPVKDARGMVRNAVLIGHGTGGSADGFLRPQFAGELFGPGQPLDATKYFIVMPDGIGHGKSSKPSDGLHAHFPHYGYTDMVTAQFRLLTEGLGVNHARLIMGTSMGGMHTWVWGEQHPDFMDALMPLASLPAQVAGRNRGWRLLGIEAIRNDPEWHGGDYQKQPPAFKTVGRDALVRRQQPSSASAPGTDARPGGPGARAVCRRFREDK